MLLSVDKNATVRRSAFAIALSSPTQLASDIPTPSIPISDSSGSDHQSNQLGVDAGPPIISSGDTRRKKARKAVPISEEARPSAGTRASSHRRTLETIHGKSSGGLLKSTEPRIDHSKASTSGRKLNKLKPPSGHAPVPAKRPPQDELDVHMGPGVSDDITLCDIDLDEGLTGTRITVPSNASPREILRKNTDELLPAPNTKPAQTLTKANGELNASGTFTKTKSSPLQDVSLNAGLGLPPTVPRSPPSTPPGLTWSKVNPGGTTENKIRRVQLDAPELVMEITFYQKPHFEVWDMPDNEYVYWPAQVNLIVKNPAQWSHKALMLPDIRMLDIQCCTKAKPIYSEFDPEAYHTVHYIGAKLQDDQGKRLPLVHENGITIEPEWVRSYGKTIGKGRNPNERGIGIGKRGWYLKIWVPIPMNLFRKRETRTFLLRACVWIGDDKGDFVETMEEMTVSHLRREREMI